MELSHIIVVVIQGGLVGNLLIRAEIYLNNWQFWAYAVANAVLISLIAVSH